MSGRRRGWRDGGSRAKEKPDVYLSKSLSKILRHKAHEMGFEVREGGFVYVDDLLEKSWLSKDSFTKDDVLRVVASNEKQRFMVQDNKDTGRLEIRANQGHSFEVPDLDLTPITDPTLYSEVIHGTYMNKWSAIKVEGLKRMKRNHIHFAPGEPGEDGVISGMRNSCDVLIFIDMERAIADGIEFYLSANNVILSKGVDGCIKPAYFSKVILRKPDRRELDFEKVT